MDSPDSEYYITFLFQCLADFNASIEVKHTASHGRPKLYTDAGLIVLFAVLSLKGIHSFKAQQRWLTIHPQWVSRLNLTSVPSRATLSRRYKQLALQLEAFLVYLGEVSMALLPGASQGVVYQDKSLFKAKGAAWHQKDRKANRVPAGVRALDSDGSWSRSHYHGWVYGYGLHLTVSSQGFPVLSAVATASVSERAVLDQQTGQLLSQNIRYLVADAGYTDLNRTEVLAKQGVLLITPVIGAKRHRARRYVEAIGQSAELRGYQQWRQVAIEPIFGLLSQLLSTDRNQKQLPVSGMGNVLTFLTLGVVLVQVAMLVNSIWGFPLRNITHLITIFR